MLSTMTYVPVSGVSFSSVISGFQTTGPRVVRAKFILVVKGQVLWVSKVLNEQFGLFRFVRKIRSNK